MSPTCPPLKGSEICLPMEDYFHIVSSIFAESEAKRTVLESIPEDGTRNRPPRKGGGTQKKSKVPGRNWQDSTSRFIASQALDTPAIFFDDELSREPAKSSESVARISSAEEDPDAPAWSIGPPTDEPDGHEMQFFEPSPET